MTHRLHRQAKARVDRGKGDRDLLLLVVGTQALEHPPGDGDIAVCRDPLGIEDIAQPVVIGQVVAAGDGFIACRAE